MRTLYRVIAATAITLPLALAGSGMALAKDGGKEKEQEKVEQAISQTIGQSNTTGAITASGSSVVTVDQANTAAQSATNSAKQKEQEKEKN